MAVDLDRLSDECEISRLLQMYCAAYDSGRWSETARLFERGVWHINDDVALRTTEEIVSFLESSIRLYDGTPKTRHVMSNIQIDVSEDRTSARADSTVIVFQSPSGEVPRVLIQAMYHDRFIRDEGQWYFAERRATVDGAGDLSTHFQSAEVAS